MKESYTQMKRNKNNIELNKNPIKLKIADPTLRRYIDLTLSKFTIKCALLVNQIEEMKKELITQVEGITECFSSQSNKLPLVSPKRKDNASSVEHALSSKIDSFNSRQFNNLQAKISMHTKAITSYLSKIDKDEAASVLTSSRKTNNIDKSGTSRQKEFILIQAQLDMPEIKSLSKETKTINEKAVIDLSPKSNQRKKAMINLSKSSLLSYQEQLKLKYLNSTMYKELNTENILSSSKAFLIQRIKDIELQKNIDLPSQTSQSSLNFIKKEDENDLKDMTNDYNKAFYKLIYTLAGLPIPTDYSYENLYEKVLRNYKVHSIKNLFLNVFLKKMIESPEDYSDEIIERFKLIIEDQPSLIIQKSLLSEHKKLSMFSFCLKEIHQMFLFEQKKRSDLCLLKNELHKLETYIKSHNINEGA